MSQFRKLKHNNEKNEDKRGRRRKKRGKINIYI